MRTRRSARAPVVLREAARAQRRLPEPVLGGDPPEAPLPGPLLVLLSRLHRSEAKPRVDEPETH